MFIKKNYATLLLILLSLNVFAQESFTIKVLDENANQLPGATISIDGSIIAQSDANGEYLFKNKSSKIQLEIKMVGYQNFNALVDLKKQNTFKLRKNTYVSEEVLVSATRIDERTAGTFSTVDKKYIEKTNLGQDLPYMLNQIPSVVITSDAGNGIGYTGIRIRGTDQTRTNLTINGIPLNDAESQGTFTVNIPDFASSVENIQVQRGVGTSTNGAGAFGASINIQTDQMPDTAFAEVNITHGTFDLKNVFHKNEIEKYTAKVNTGLINNHWNFSGRLSKISSVGYVNGSSGILKSFFTSASYRDKRHLIKFNVFSGQEKTFLAWGGVPQDSLKTNRRYNPIIADYPDQYDSYQQDHYQVFESFKLNSRNHLNIGYHFTRGQGFFQEYRADQSLSSYLADDIIVGSDTITESDILRRRWLRNEFWGVVYSWEYNNNNNLRITVGGAANDYRGEHFGEVVWAENSATIRPNQRFYEGWGIKQEFNTYAKVNYDINKKWNSFIDLQVRFVDYTINGTNKDQVVLDQSHKFNFFNPKAGVSYTKSPNELIYFTYGMANKEPNRDDLINGMVNGQAPKPEQLHDFELGWKKRRNKFNWEMNYYYMYYVNQLVLTGEVNNVGEYLRINTPSSYRAGIELSGAWNYSNKFSLSGALNMSQNKIKEFTEYIYDENTYALSVVRDYKDTDISFAPSLVASTRARVQIINNMFLSLESKYVGKQYLDNTSNDLKSIDAFFVNDLFIDYNLKVHKIIPQLSLVLKINNVFNEVYEANGYTFSLMNGTQENIYNYYYPQAGRNYMLALNFRF
jgi:iron complex outermembrane receptor protein